MKIIVVDDDNLVAVSLKTIIETSDEMQVMGIGNSGKEAISLYRAHQPDILLMDIRMPDMSGLETGEMILSEFPDAKILYLTTFNDDDYIAKALRIGAKGYIIKQDFESLIPSLSAVRKGQSVFGGEVAERIPGLLQNNPPVLPRDGFFDSATHGLTEQETAITKCVADGMSNREIAECLFLSEGTVRNYLSNILKKLELRDRTNLAIYYYKHRE